jgi:hypothetical protein
MEEVGMDTSTISRDIKNTQDETMKFAAPLQAMWKASLVDLPFGMVSETLRFFGHRLQAHGEYLASLNTCKSLPEVIDCQSHFVRITVDEYGQETNKLMQGVRGKITDMRSQIGKAA